MVSFDVLMLEVMFSLGYPLVHLAVNLIVKVLKF